MLPKIPKITHLKELSVILNEERFPIIGFDTSFILKTLVDGLAYHKECVQFVKDLISLKPQPIVIYSEILREELWCANLMRELKDLHKIEINIKKLMRKYPLIPRNFYPKTVDINKKFDELLGNFIYRESIPLNNKVTAGALSLIHKYNLLGADAIHIASMTYNDIGQAKHIVAFDDDIENITDICVWTVGGINRYVENHYKEWGFKTKPHYPA